MPLMNGADMSRNIKLMEKDRRWKKNIKVIGFSGNNVRDFMR